MWTRRQFLRRTGYGVAGVAAGTVGYTFLVEPHWLEFTRPRLPVAGLPAELAGKTIAHLSDLHVGPQVDDEYLLETFRRTAALAPDFTVVTGDWVSYQGPAQLEQLRQVLADFPHGRLGSFGIYGNHDYGWNWSETAVAEQIRTIARDAGVTFLANAAASAGGLQFVGLDDYWSPHYNPVPILRAHGADPATIVLCHNPDVCDHPVWGDYAGWVLSGHTHGGQCKPPFLPPPLLPVENRRYTSGAFDLKGHRRLYISRGVGTLLPVRFNARPEVALFTLERA